MQPTFGGRGGCKAGTLEAHTNGLRYVGAKAEEQVDVIYSNIKNAFFQPAKKEIKTLIHFHLHDAIMIGKKKTKVVLLYLKSSFQDFGGLVSSDSNVTGDFV